MRIVLTILFVLSMIITSNGCRVVRISNDRLPQNGSPMMTTYSLTDMASSGRYVYRSDTSDLYLYFTSGKWVVGITVGALDGYTMYTTDDHFNADEITGTFFSKQHGVWVESPDVNISCTVENVALGKPVSQSSTHGSNTAELAVDGEKGTSVPANQCTLTNPEDDPSWQVDLRRNHAIGSVRVKNRGDCCGGRLHGFIVQVKQAGQSWQRCGAQYSETPEDGQSILVDCGRPMVARYVQIKLPGKSESLSLCEVEVFTYVGCPRGHIVYGGYCYKPHNTAKTRQEALTTCRQEGGVLAMPRHRHTNRFLTGVATRVDTRSDFFIGLSKESEEWAWDDGKPLCGYRGWGAGYPSTTGNNCTVLRFDGSWQDRPCETTAKFICQTQSTVDLTTVGYQQHGEGFFRVSTTRKTFDEAKLACDRFAGGRLAQPKTEDLNDYIQGKIGEASLDDGARIGIRIQTTEEPWSFLDGTQGDTSHSNWAPEQPSGKGCATMTSDGRWSIGDCEEEAPYVCQIGDVSSCEEEPVPLVYCGGQVSGSSGQISSPGNEEDANYPNNLRCRWDITVPENKRIELTPVEFDLERNDSLQVNDVCIHGYSVAVLTGSDVPSPIVTSTNKATVSFTSDDSYSGKGFRINYRAVSLFETRSSRSLDDVMQEQGRVRSERGLVGVINVVGGILSGVKKVMDIFSSLEEDRRHQEIMNVMTQVQNKLEEVDDKFEQQGITNALNNQIQLTNIIHSPSTTKLDGLLRQMSDLRVDSNGTFQPEGDALALAQTVLSPDSEGMSQILGNMHNLVMGRPSVLNPQQKPILETMEAFFRNENLQSFEYWAKMETISEYFLERQVAGYGLWIFAKKLTGGTEEEINGIIREARGRLSEQMCSLAPFFFGWPAGTYGLPKTTEGCPSGPNVDWEDGRYEHQRKGSFDWAKDRRLHFSGRFSSNNLAKEFCVKTNSSGDADNWPRGRYCVLKYGSCPKGLKWGKLAFPGGTWTGVVPDGRVDSDSIEMEYCCQEDGFASNPINLPPRRSFYMLRFGGECQQVAGMTVREEWVEYKGNGFAVGVTPDDDGDDDNSHKLYYCFYSVPGSNIDATQIVVSAAVSHTANVLNFVTSVIISCAAALWVVR
ncbi:PREDICTED: uncharacterized protein LOC109472616 [Branchiostoma belcheri]|uniref:Uncharacterized protein LOC109472616 n=1 Tax=Branchiostoma belcheri TaxID=7741 RepID=A0A6P4Z218_BRABE|nr:PREDICTED: uncharacterized protein LOC109472616 [Branchiostoma belcheri]XP_019627984.1 PREDICTED: uncharacterized protein LOC109472616 [Branchiostoma belcheri]XP_019627985.1 PREDICTED: uncharacterized protein LOC109472616 [Branchiostoma belcheri]